MQIEENRFDVLTVLIFFQPVDFDVRFEQDYNLKFKDVFIRIDLYGGLILILIVNLNIRWKCYVTRSKLHFSIIHPKINQIYLR